jgi:hypothetical protein
LGRRSKDKGSLSQSNDEFHQQVVEYRIRKLAGMLYKTGALDPIRAAGSRRGDAAGAVATGPARDTDPDDGAADGVDR